MYAAMPAECISQTLMMFLVSNSHEHEQEGKQGVARHFQVVVIGSLCWVLNRIKFWLF